MMRFLLILGAIVGLSWLSPAEARRAALIIGNSNYVHATSLPNPPRDAALVAESARKAGFDVTMVSDLTKTDFDQALREFRQKADGAEVALIYYAGHGIQSGGSNWLIPVDAALAESRDLRFEAIDLGGLLETMILSQLRIVILDACRENPFGSSWSSAVAGVPSGLVEEKREGSMVIFAAGAGQFATDGVGDNSPFARSVARRLSEPGLSIHRLAASIRDDVLADTGGKQEPWLSSAIPSRDFALVEATGGTGQQVAAAADADGQFRLDSYSWRYYSQMDTADAYKQYLKEFPNGFYAAQASMRIAQIAAGQRPVAPPTSAMARSTAPAAAQPAAPVSRPATPAAPAATRPRPAAVVTPVTPAPAPAASGANIAAVQPSALTDAAPLPQLPSTPLFPRDGYPSCREDYAQITDPIGRINKINECQSRLTDYVSGTMNVFASKMIAHQMEITQIYQNKVGGRSEYTPESQDRFYKAMMREHADSNPDGAHFADYRAAKKRYDDDSAYLKDRYCANTGTCGGYPVPPGIAPTAGK